MVVCAASTEFYTSMLLLSEERTTEFTHACCTCFWCACIAADKGGLESVSKILDDSVKGSTRGETRSDSDARVNYSTRMNEFFVRVSLK